MGKKKTYRHKPHGPYEAFFKRGLDVVLSGTAIIVLSPVLAVTALLVRIKLGSPVLFVQDRPGMIDPTTGKEKIFKLYKFRTMLEPKDGVIDPKDDAKRLTPFGKKLRSTSLDELPELFNILKGDMSIVGPRPLLVRYLPYYTKEERHRHDVRPGLTGLAQINGRNYLMWDKRIALDVEYVNNISFFSDMEIIIKTIAKVLKREDVSEKRITPLDKARRGENGI